jgi:hypothetical protein
MCAKNPTEDNFPMAVAVRPTIRFLSVSRNLNRSSPTSESFYGRLPKLCRSRFLDHWFLHHDSLGPRGGPPWCAPFWRGVLSGLGMTRMRTIHTTSPPRRSPLLCPDCRTPLAYQESFISGVGHIEQWDILTCRRCKHWFEFRHRTQKLRRCD